MSRADVWLTDLNLRPLDPVEVMEGRCQADLRSRGRTRFGQRALHVLDADVGNGWVSATSRSRSWGAGGECALNPDRVWTAGADVVVVPMVNNAGDAVSAVTATRYPPNGTRSVGPYRAPRGSPLCIVQIETREGVDHVEEIAAIDGVDSLMIGPGDLALSIGRMWIATTTI
jgi:HpcH/HpaI aldolase/citrate lyase family